MNQNHSRVRFKGRQSFYTGFHSFQWTDGVLWGWFPFSDESEWMKNNCRRLLIESSPSYKSGKPYFLKTREQIEPWTQEVNLFLEMRCRTCRKSSNQRLCNPGLFPQPTRLVLSYFNIQIHLDLSRISIYDFLTAPTDSITCSSANQMFSVSFSAGSYPGDGQRHVEVLPSLQPEAPGAGARQRHIVGAHSSRWNLKDPLKWTTSFKPQQLEGRERRAGAE